MQKAHSVMTLCPATAMGHGHAYALKRVMRYAIYGITNPQPYCDEMTVDGNGIFGVVRWW